MEEAVWDDGGVATAGCGTTVGSRVSVGREGVTVARDDGGGTEAAWVGRGGVATPA
ncbi:hypothetical protein Ancab_021396, partial [Ancistrocladus abbreviatus]